MAVYDGLHSGSYVLKFMKKIQWDKMMIKYIEMLMYSGIKRNQIFLFNLYYPELQKFAGNV